MFCRFCGHPIDPRAPQCMYCGMLAFIPLHRKFYRAGFVLGILSLCIPMYGIILGIIGLPLACISKRVSSIIMNSIGIFIWVALLAFYIFSMSVNFMM